MVAIYHCRVRIYEFECRICDKRVEQRDREAPDCPDCKVGRMRRVYSLTLAWPMEERGH